MDESIKETHSLSASESRLNQISEDEKREVKREVSIRSDWEIQIQGKEEDEKREVKRDANFACTCDPCLNFEPERET